MNRAKYGVKRIGLIATRYIYGAKVGIYTYRAKY